MAVSSSAWLGLIRDFTLDFERIKTWTTAAFRAIAHVSLLECLVMTTGRHPNDGPNTEAAARTTRIRALHVLRQVAAKLTRLVARDSAAPERKHANADVFYL